MISGCTPTPCAWPTLLYSYYSTLLYSALLNFTLHYSTILYSTLTTLLSTSFPGSLILPPRASEERPWLGLVTCYFDNWEHRGGVLCNQAVCRVELCRAATALQAEISNSIYSNVYLKVRQGCLEIFYLSRDVVAVVPIEYLWRVGYISTVDVEQCNFILEMILNCCFSFKITRSDW